MIGVEVNSVIYPVPIELPGRDAHAVAAPESGPEGEHKPWAGGERRVERASVARNGSAPNGRRGIPARAALGMAVVASFVGVLLGRRSASSD
jgi:hypothetical protein